MAQAEAKVILDSIDPLTGIRVTTLQLRYQRFIHSEFMTHRVFSRNASSSRAVPVKKVLRMVATEPAMPVHWGQNQPGMQADHEVDDETKKEMIRLWMLAAQNAALVATQMEALGGHKQVVNRILEPFSFIQVVVTATYYDGFFELRLHKDADPNIQVLAQEMKKAMDESEPVSFEDRKYHLPYIKPNEAFDFDNIEEAVKCSIARCARVSYILHDGTPTDKQKDLELYDRLVGAVPFHASPLEHQARLGNATDFAIGPTLNGNLSKPIVQFRKCFERGEPEMFWRK